MQKEYTPLQAPTQRAGTTSNSIFYAMRPLTQQNKDLRCLLGRLNWISGMSTLGLAAIRISLQSLRARPLPPAGDKSLYSKLSVRVLFRAGREWRAMLCNTKCKTAARPRVDMQADAGVDLNNQEYHLNLNHKS